MSTISPKDLQSVLNILARAQASVAEHSQIHNSVQTLLQLANQTLPIGAVKPDGTKSLETLQRLQRDIEEREATLATKDARGASEEG